MTNNPQPDDKFARESFTLRRMTNWQLWGITIFTVVVVVGLLIYATSM